MVIHCRLFYTCILSFVRARYELKTGVQLAKTRAGGKVHTILKHVYYVRLK